MEKQKAVFQELARARAAATSSAASHLRAQVSHITSKCFTLCISGAPGKSLGSYEQACLSQARERSVRSVARRSAHSCAQCALRFLESNEVVISRMSGGGQK